MSDRRNYSPSGRGGGGIGGSAGGYDWSDDEYSPRTHGREKFRRERSLERDHAMYSRGPDDYDRYDRKKRLRRSITPPEERRHSKRRASFSKMGSPPPHGGDYGSVARGAGGQRDPDYHHQADGDHYIPNYERDGYAPAPRYSNIPESQSSPAFGYPMVGDGVNVSMMGGVWPAMSRMPALDLDQLDYVVPFKQFCDHLRSVHSRSHFDEDELQKRYQHYKEKVLARQLSSFFANNKDKQWFQEKYHPKLSKDRIDDTKRRRVLSLHEFQKQLQDGKYDDVNYDAPKADPETSGNEEAKEEGDVENASGQEDQDMSAVEYESHLIIKTVPPTIARQKIIEMCSGVEGFEYLVLSEPSPNKKFHRIGWIHFKQGTDMQKAFNELDSRKIDDFVFHLAMNQKNQYQSRTSKVTPEIACTVKRLQRDIDQAKQLAKHLESELGDDANGLAQVTNRAKEVIAKHAESNDRTDMETDDASWELKKELDMILAYLRHVHMYCYYCALECDSLEEINRRCVDPHLRKVSGTGEEVDPKQIAKNDKNGTQWAKNIDQKIAMKLNAPDDRELEKWGGKSLKKEMDNYIKEHVLKEHEAKYKCRVGDCTKAFKGYEYVEKHIFTKHNEDVDAIKEEVEYYNSYVCDPNHLVQASNPHMNNGNMGMGSMNNGMHLSMPSFMMPGMNNGMRAPPGMGHVQGATFGTPWDQIPRIGFGESNWAMGNRRGAPGRSKMLNDRLGKPASGSSSFDLDDGLPRDPRQVKSYVDLDAPAEGDADISFY